MYATSAIAASVHIVRKRMDSCMCGVASEGTFGVDIRDRTARYEEATRFGPG